MNKNVFALTITLTLSASLFCGVANAELVRSGVWKIETGDTLESILEKTMKGQPLRQKRLANLIPKISPSSFDDSGNLIAGKALRIPGAKLPKSKKTVNTNIAGRVLASTGTIFARNKTGVNRHLKRGDSVKSGDKLITKQGKAQVRFTDGSLMALKPNTELVIEEYRFNGSSDGTEKSVYNLLKGSLRSLSGSIGKLNKENYQLKTPVATIGIRGTDYAVTLCKDGSCGNLPDGIYCAVADGQIIATAGGESYTYGTDNYFFISSDTKEAKTLLNDPGVVFIQDKRTVEPDNKRRKKTGETGETRTDSYTDKQTTDDSANLQNSDTDKIENDEKTKRILQISNDLEEGKDISQDSDISDNKNGDDSTGGGSTGGGSTGGGSTGGGSTGGGSTGGGSTGGGSTGGGSTGAPLIVQMQPNSKVHLGIFHANGTVNERLSVSSSVTSRYETDQGDPNSRYLKATSNNNTFTFFDAATGSTENATRYTDVGSIQSLGLYWGTLKNTSTSTATYKAGGTQHTLDKDMHYIMADEQNVFTPASPGDFAAFNNTQQTLRLNLTSVNASTLQGDKLQKATGQNVNYLELDTNNNTFIFNIKMETSTGPSQNGTGIGKGTYNLYSNTGISLDNFLANHSGHTVSNSDFTAEYQSLSASASTNLTDSSNSMDITLTKGSNTSPDRGAAVSFQASGNVDGNNIGIYGVGAFSNTQP